MQKSFYKSACLFEASLILVALALGWFTGINPFATLQVKAPAILIGVLGTAPLFMMFLVLEKIQGEPVAAIRKFLMNVLGPNLHSYHWMDLLWLAAIAGVSEELLFRGVIQPWIEVAWGMTAGLWVSNIVFGLLHAMTPLYAVLAALVGVYLGFFLDVGGERNILVPIIIHGLYDFLALVSLMRVYRASLTTQA